jgi:hypothetical protein
MLNLVRLSNTAELLEDRQYLLRMRDRRRSGPFVVGYWNGWTMTNASNAPVIALAADDNIREMYDIYQLPD